MLAEQDARTLPDPGDLLEAVERRATVENQALAQNVFNKMQKVRMCVCILLTLGGSVKPLHLLGSTRKVGLKPSIPEG